ncbi:MAG: hypothetical protein EXS05_07265 [Planctomycetaceae bacterium]|nr:hypothetical protein [Planctomycetaceae bacterium]
MPLISLACNHCGAALEIPPDTHFVTCRFCSSQLDVQHAGNAVFTKVLEVLDQRTAAMANDLETIKRQNELERFDREWQRERERYLVRGKQGRTTVPTTTTSVMMLAVGVVAGVLWIGAATAQAAPFPVLLFGVMFVLVVIVGSLGIYVKAQTYHRRHRDYESRRQKLLEK